MMYHFFHSWLIVFVLTHPAGKRCQLPPAVPHHTGLNYPLIFSVKFHQKCNTKKTVTFANMCHWRQFGSSTDQVRPLSVTPHLFFMHLCVHKVYVCVYVWVYPYKSTMWNMVFLNCETAWSPSTCSQTHLAVRASPSRVARWQHGLTMHIVRFQLHYGATNTLGGRTHQETAATRQNEACGTASEGKAGLLLVATVSYRIVSTRSDKSYCNRIKLLF